MQHKYKCLDTNRLKHKPEQLKVKSRNTNANMTARVGKICWLGQIQARQKRQIQIPIKIATMTAVRGGIGWVGPD